MTIGLGASRDPGPEFEQILGIPCVGHPIGEALLAFLKDQSVQVAATASLRFALACSALVAWIRCEPRSRIDGNYLQTLASFATSSTEASIGERRESARALSVAVTCPVGLLLWLHFHSAAPVERDTSGCCVPVIYGACVACTTSSSLSLFFLVLVLVLFLSTVLSVHPC